MANAEPLSIVIVDDEPLGRERLRAYLSEHPDVEIIGEFGDGAEALEALHDLDPDLLFVDIQMPVMGGMEMVERLGPDRMPLTVFVTAFDQFAIQAFEAQAMDYLLKPFERERLDASLERARGLVRQRRALNSEDRLISLLESRTGPRHPQRFMVKTGSQYVFVRTDDIEWIESADNYVTLHVAGKKYLLRETVTRMEERLDPDRFLRVRHSTIVNLEKVQAIRVWSGTEYQILLQDGTTVLSSRRYRPRIRALLHV